MVVSKKTKQSKTKQSKKTKTKKYVSKPSYSKTLTDLQSLKSISSLSSISSIKSDITIGDIYNSIDKNEDINKLCINKIKNIKYNNIQLDKTIAKNLCHCIFDKNYKLTIEQLENKIKQKLHTPGSECIKLLDKFIKDKLNKKKSASKKSASKKSASKKSASKK